MFKIAIFNFDAFDGVYFFVGLVPHIVRYSLFGNTNDNNDWKNSRDYCRAVDRDGGDIVQDKYTQPDAVANLGELE